MMLLLCLFVLLTNASDQWLTASGSEDNTRSRTFSARCSINTETVSDLSLLWKRELTGNILGTPTLDGRGGLYVTSYGNTTSGSKGTLYKLDEDDGTVLWSSVLEECSGFPGAQSRNSPALSLKHKIVVVGDVKSGTLMGFDLNTGECKWFNVIDNHPLACLTSNVQLDGDVGYVGVASQEGAFLPPDYPCCTFVGSLNKFRVKDGVLLWKKNNIPPELIGSYSGAAIMNQAVLYRDTVCCGTSNTYNAPLDVQACELLRRQNTSLPSCVPPEVMFDSLLCRKKSNGDLVWTRRFDPFDAFNLACLTGGPMCPSIAVGTDSDFSSNIMSYKLKNGDDRAAICQKNGNCYIFNLTDGHVYSTTVIGTSGGVIGGNLWGGCLWTDPKSKNVTLIGSDVNVQAKTFTLLNGTNITVGHWSALDASGNGAIKWEVVAEPGAQTRSSTTIVNGVLFLGTQHSLRGLELKSGKLLWTFETGATMIHAPSIQAKRLYFGSGYPETHVGIPANKLYAFQLSRAACRRRGCDDDE